MTITSLCGWRTILCIAAFALGLVACGGNRSDPYSGTLQAPSAAVGSTIGGRITQVLVNEGDAVSSGRVLVRFDDIQERSDLASAIARVEQARAQYEIARTGQPYQESSAADEVRQAQARRDDALAAARDAHSNAVRTSTLYGSGDVSAQQRDAALAQARRADAQVAAATAALQAAQTQFSNAANVTLPQTATGALAAYRAAQGALAQARNRLGETVVRAPADGVVAAMNLHPGDLVAPGASVATIDERGDPFVRIYVPQAELGKFRVGTRLAVHSDALPGETFIGTVENIDARAQFTPLNVQTESDRAGLSFGVKVQVADSARRLEDGTTVGVSSP